MVTKVRNYKVPYEKVYNASVEALLKSGFKIEAKTAGTIKASSGWTDLRSWGESIEVELRESAEGVEVKVSSVPRAQLFDWGKSEENLSRFFANLDKCLSQH